MSFTLISSTPRMAHFQIYTGSEPTVIYREDFLAVLPKGALKDLLTKVYLTPAGGIDPVVADYASFTQACAENGLMLTHTLSKNPTLVLRNAPEVHGHVMLDFATEGSEWGTLRIALAHSIIEG